MTRQPIFAHLSRTATQAVLGAVAAFATVPAIAGAAAPQQAVPVADKPAAEQKVCVKTTPTGSRIARMVCMTRADFIARSGVDPFTAK